MSKLKLFGLGLITLALGAATLINPLQIKPPATGQFVLTSTNGVIAWGPALTQVINFSDGEVPGNAINGANAVFTLAHGDTTTGTSLMLIRNGVVQTGGGVDYTLSATGTTITFVAASTPQTGDTLVAWYRY
jgi:hypothetical protein